MAKVRMRLCKFTFAVKNCQSSTVIKQGESGITSYTDKQTNNLFSNFVTVKF